MKPNPFESVMRRVADRRKLVAASIGLAGSLAATRGLAQEATPEPGAGSDAGRSADAIPGRVVLNSALSEVAPGYELALGRVVTPPGDSAPDHYHTGLQVVYIDSGRVRITVVRGEMPYTSDGKEGVLRAGEELDLGPGDRMVVQPGMVHRVENRGSIQAVAYEASLFLADLPSGIPVEPIDS